MTAQRCRHRSVPERQYADRVVVARPSDGAPVVLPPTAASIWRALDEWRTAGELDAAVARAYPEVAVAVRTSTVQEVLAVLEEEDLLERG